MKMDDNNISKEKVSISNIEKKPTIKKDYRTYLRTIDTRYYTIKRCRTAEQRVGLSECFKKAWEMTISDDGGKKVLLEEEEKRLENELKKVKGELNEKAV